MTTRDTLRAEARALVLHGVLEAGVLRELVGGKRFDRLALDVLQLTSVFQAHRDAIAGRSGIDERYLARAEQQVDDMLTALGHKALGPQSAAAELRDRAFSLMAHTTTSAGSSATCGGSNATRSRSLRPSTPTARDAAGPAKEEDRRNVVTGELETTYEGPLGRRLAIGPRVS